MDSSAIWAAEVIVLAARVYLWIGFAFAVPFVLFLVGRVDPGARQSTWTFRLILIPSAVWMWPLLAWRLLRGRGPTEERNAHRELAREQLGERRSDS